MGQKMSRSEAWLTDSQKQFKILYGILSFLLIPLFAILFSYPVRVVVWLASQLPFVTSVHYIPHISIGISYVMAFCAYIYLWRLWNRKNGRTKVTEAPPPSS